MITLTVSFLHVKDTNDSVFQINNKLQNKRSLILRLCNVCEMQKHKPSTVGKRYNKFCHQLVPSNWKALWQLWGSSWPGEVPQQNIFTKQHLFNCSLLNFGGKLLRSLAKVSIFGHTCKYSYVSYRFLWHGYLTNCWWSYFMAEYQFLDDYILGYEIVNEPWCGDVYEVPFKCIRRK